MRQKRVGPISPTQGLVLQPLDVDSGALHDALNVVARDGELCSRLGRTHFGNVAPTLLDDEAGYIAGASQVWTAAVGYLLFDLSIWAEDQVAGFTVETVASPASLTETSDVVFEYYSAAGTWKTLEVDMTRYLAQGLTLYWPFNGDTWDGIFRFVMPHDFANSDPLALGGPYGDYGWVRVTGTDFNGLTVSAVDGYTEGGGAKLHGIRSFPTRNGWMTVGVREYVSGGSIVCDIVDVKLDLTPRFNSIASSVGAYDASGMGSGDVVYIPATDSFLLASGSKHIAFEHDGDDWTMSDLEFDNTSTDNAWEDIPRASSIPPSQCLALFDGRVFAADRDGVVRWSAPSEFWTIWPLENEYRLSGLGATKVIGMVPMQGALYIFTEGEIWRAVSGEPVEGQDSLVAFSQVEAIGCAARNTIVAQESLIYFLANDGVRSFDGQTSRLVTEPVSDLFSAASESEWAIRNLAPCAGVIHEREREYRLYYPSAGGTRNDTCLVISLDDGSCWIWGAPHLTSVDASGEVGQRRWGCRVDAATYRPDLGYIFAASPLMCVDKLDDGYLDGASKIEWYAETQNLGLGASGKKRVVKVDVEAARLTSSKMSVGVVVDGRRRDVREVSQQVDASIGTSALGSGNAAGQALVEDYGSWAPYVWRGSSVGRSFRVRVASDSTVHAPARIAGITVDYGEER